MRRRLEGVEEVGGKRLFYLRERAENGEGKESVAGGLTLGQGLRSSY